MQQKSSSLFRSSGAKLRNDQFQDIREFLEFRRDQYRMHGIVVEWSFSSQSDHLRIRVKPLERGRGHYQEREIFITGMELAAHDWRAVDRPLHGAMMFIRNCMEGERPSHIRRTPIEVPIRDWIQPLTAEEERQGMLYVRPDGNISYNGIDWSEARDHIANYRRWEHHQTSVNNEVKEAEEKAEKLLVEKLSSEQQKQWKSWGKFFVSGGTSGLKYLLGKGRVYNIEVYLHGKKIGKLCVTAKDSQIPICDMLLAQKLMLETDEEKFIKLANAN